MTELPDPWVFAVLAVAAARLVHFVLWDSLAGLSLDSGTKIAQRLDVWAFDQDGNDRGAVRGKIGTGLVCPYCVGGWLSLAVVSFYTWAPPWEIGRAGALTWVAVWAVQCVLSAADHKYLVE